MKPETLPVGNAPRFQSGMTLLEVLVVVSILALVVAALPLRSFTALGAVELRAAVRDMATDLRRTRSAAIESGAAKRFILDVGNRRYGQAGEKSLPDDIGVRFVAARQELLGSDTGSVVFMPDGSATGGSITLDRDTRQARIDIAWLTGQVTLHDE